MIIIFGRIGTRSYRVAGRRLHDCEGILNRYGLHFPPLFHGTLNIDLDQIYLTPPNAIFIPAAELDSIGQTWREDWRLIRVDQINGYDIEGYIFRAGQKAHPDSVAELITKDLRSMSEFNISPGQNISLRIASRQTCQPASRREILN